MNSPTVSSSSTTSTDPSSAGRGGPRRCVRPDVSVEGRLARRRGPHDTEARTLRRDGSRPRRVRRARGRCRAPSRGPCRCPFLISLVEKNGSKIRSITSGAMPCPSSSTTSSTKRSVDGLAAARADLRLVGLQRPHANAQVTDAGPSVASRALMQRFSSTCSTWLGSTSTGAARLVDVKGELERARQARSQRARARPCTTEARETGAATRGVRG